MTPARKKRIDRLNVKVFKKYEISNSGEMRHICTECGQRCSIDGSVSRRGHELMCKRCFYKKEFENQEFSQMYFDYNTHSTCNICGQDFVFDWGE